MYYDYYGEPYLSHHGIKGQKWGVRRFQNEDGSYTDAGSKRYASSGKSTARIGSSQRVRQHQQRILDKINNDKGDKNILLRNTVNDYRHGRIAALENKARSREALERYKQNKTSENRGQVIRQYGERYLKNAVLGGGSILNVTTPMLRGTYNRYRGNGEDYVKAGIKTFGKYSYPYVAGIATAAGMYDVDDNS